MPAPKHRSGTLRKIFTRTPSGNTVLHYSKRKPNKAQCRLCGAELKGMPRVRAIVLKRIALTKKRPTRPFGGNLCSGCMRSVFIKKARSMTL